MKLGKKILTWLLVGTMLVGAFPAAVFADEDTSVPEEAIEKAAEVEEIEADMPADVTETTPQEAEEEAQEAVPAPEEVQVENVVEETVVSAENLLPEEEELLELYIEETTAALVGEGESEPELPNKAARYWKLGETERKAYLLIKNELKKICSGKRQDTEIILTYNELFGDAASHRYTAAELGVDSIVQEGAITGEAVAALQAAFSMDYLKVFYALSSDCSDLLYWFDKTAGVAFPQLPAISAEYNNEEGDWEILFTEQSFYGVGFSVADEYFGGNITIDDEGNEHHYSVDAARIEAVTTAITNAADIVNAAAEESDYRKLEIYKDTICEEVSYNEAVVTNNSNTAYGNPWQLIYVFDKDKQTNVVCEGYSKAFKFLCDLSTFNDDSIGCLLVTGLMEGGTGAGLHMWNLVLAGGKSYLVDVTNCDGPAIGAPDKLFMRGAEENSANITGSKYYFSNRLSLPISYEYDSQSIALFGEEERILATEDYKESTTGDPDPENPDPENPDPENPDPENPDPENPDPENPDPENPDPENPDPKDPEPFVLASPTDLRWEQEADKIFIAWTCVEGAEKYLVDIFLGDEKLQSVTLEAADIQKYEVSDLIYQNGGGSYRFALRALAMQGEQEIVTEPVNSGILSFVIDITGATVNGITSKTYDGKAQTQNLTVSLNIGGVQRVLTAGTDYKVTYENNTNAGTATVTVTGIGNYQGTITKSFTISKLSIEKATITGVVAKNYTGKALTQAPTVKMTVGGVLRTLKLNTDYKLSYKNNTKIGTGTVTITGTGNYTGAVPKTFIIKRAQKITVSNLSKTYKKGATYKLNAKVLDKAKLTYATSNKKVATVDKYGKVKIQGLGVAKITIKAAATKNCHAATKVITVSFKYANPLSVKAKTATVKYSAVKKANQTIATKYVLSITKKGQGTVTYAKVSGNGKITINKTTGKVTVAKGLKKGTYKVKIKVMAAGNSRYFGATRTITISVKVK